MRGRQPFRRFGRVHTLALVLYALFLVTAQFEHHDLACELKTPLHCTSCTSSQLGSDPQPPVGLERCRLFEVGTAVVLQRQLYSALFVTLTSGRSPPSRS